LEGRLSENIEPAHQTVPWLVRAICPSGTPLAHASVNYEGRGAQMLCAWRNTPRVPVLLKGQAMRILTRLWTDESGFVISSELLIIVTITVIGLIVGMVAVRDAVVQELADVAAAIGALDQSYQYSGVSNTCSSAGTHGGQFVDDSDGCDQSATQTGTAADTITITAGIAPEDA
jgi:hypothetical protein